MGKLVTKAPKLVTRSVTLPVGSGGSVRLAAVADTHSQPHAETAKRLAELAPDAILHGGDIGELAVLDELAKIAPVYAVRGNIDTRARDLPDVLTIEVGALRILLTHIAVYGPRLRGEVARMAKAEKAALVVCGHSHVPFIGVDHGITVFNPGSIGPRRFPLPIVLWPHRYLAGRRQTSARQLRDRRTVESAVARYAPAGEIANLARLSAEAPAPS